MASIEEKILEFGQKRLIDELQQYIKQLDLDKLVNLIKTKLSNTNFVDTWSYILQGFSYDEESHHNRFKIISVALKQLEEVHLRQSHYTMLIQPLRLEVAKLKTKHLVELCNFCLENLQCQKVSHLSWKNLLPEILNVIVEKEVVDDDEKPMTGIEYKQKFIDSLCSLLWSTNIVILMTSMFIDIQLTKDQHLKVINKLSHYFEKMTPEEIPPFVYQVLQLCKNHTCRPVFLKLQNYFSLRIYQNFRYTIVDSDRTDSEAIEDANKQNVIEAESTVLYHIHSAAALNYLCIKDYLTSLKNLLRSPEFVLHPFQLAILLDISSIFGYEERCFEIIRACISKTYHEEQKRINCAWFRDMVPNTCKIESIFVQVIEFSYDRELLQGLVNFAFVLLGVGASLGRDPVAEKQWQLGNMILFKVIKRKRNTATVIMQHISNAIMIGQNVSQYIECLYIISKNLPLLVLDNRSLVTQVMEALVEMPASNATQLLDVIVLLTKLSPTIRDSFILLLRKALYSKSTETRQLAVNGFLKLLSKLKISNFASLSQSSSSSGSFSSGHSLYTQLSLHRTSQTVTSVFSNEVLCLEVLNILKICFRQQNEVRTQLYDGLYETIRLNPELGIQVLTVIGNHFFQYYVLEEETLPPLNFQKAILTKDVNVVVQESLGKLIYALGLVVIKCNETDAENPVVVKFKKILEVLSNQMAKCELVHLAFDDGTDLLDIVPESRQKLAILKELLCSFEALIGYKIFSWDIESEGRGKEVNALFQAYSRFLQFSKTLSRPKKAEKRKKDGVTTQQTQQTANNTTIRSDRQKSQKRTFEPPDTILNFEVMVKTLRLLHEPAVPWTTNANANAIKTKREFHQHIMQAAITLITSLKHKKIIDHDYSKTIFNHVTNMAVVIYDRIVKRFNEFMDFDCATAVLAFECFLLILNTIIAQFKSNFQLFLDKIVGKQGEISAHLSEIIEVYEKLFETDEEELSEDPVIKKNSLVVANTLHVLSSQLPETSSAGSVQLLDWLKNYAVTNTVSSRQVASSFINLFFDAFMKFKISLTFFEQASLRIGEITGVVGEDEPEAEELKIINEQSVNNILLSLSNAMKSIIEDINWIISRMKAEFYMLTYPGTTHIERKREYLKIKEKGVCCHLSFVVTIMKNLSNCTVPPGNLSEAIFKNLVLLFSTLGALAKYFIIRSSKVDPVFQRSRFETLVRQAGKGLAPVVYRLIMYIEQSQKQDASATQEAKKKTTDSSVLKNKVLKETRMIPKVVYEIEQFGNAVIKLSNKTKVDLAKYVGQGIVRDFRILDLKKVLASAQDGAPTQLTRDSTSTVGNEESGEEEEPTPSPKRSRRN